MADTPLPTTTSDKTKPAKFADLKFDFPALLATMMTVLFAAVTLSSGFTNFHIDADVKQTLFALTALTWGYYFGSSTGSKAKDASKDATIAALTSPPKGPTP